MMTPPSPFPDNGSGSGRPTRRPAPRRTADRLLADRVVDRLAGDERTRMQGITVEVQNGVAILTGQVDMVELRSVAGDLAWQTAGITDVCNVLQPSGPDDLGGVQP